ncbi:MAG: hypothetical protein COB98_04440 [Flavobacteriaceae bacterium]|nr:MAG: hypothetical protein COB98_04440 [Flavobacteriaceae bacterium]
MMFLSIKHAIRNLLKNKIYSTIIIGGFSLGFTACILIGLFYNAEHQVNKGFDNYKNIYRVYDVKLNKSNLDYALFPVLTQHYSEVEIGCPVEYMAGYEFTIKDKETNTSTRIDKLIVTNNNFFELFSVEIIASLGSTPFMKGASVIITESVAKKLYGDKSPLGKIITEDFFEGTITAVIKDLPANSSFQAELLLNSDHKKFQMSQACDKGICVYPTSHFIALNSGVDVSLFTKKLNQTIHHYNTNVDRLALQNIQDIYLSNLSFEDAHFKGNSNLLIIFLAIAILIIFLSSINYLNYTISMQYAKLKEIGILKTNGASWSQLMVNSCLEITLGILISLSISVVLTWMLIPYSEALFGKTINLSTLNLWSLLPVFSGIILIIIVVNSLAPMYVLSRFKITDFLSGSRKRNGKQFGKQFMLIFQLTISIALIAIVLLIFKQLQFIKQVDLGFKKEHLVRIEIPYLHKNPSLIQEETGKLPFVLGSTLSDGYPGMIKLTMGSNVEDNNFMIHCMYISDDYLQTMGIDLLEGREFHLGDENNVCLLNKEAVKKFGWDTIEGKKYNSGTPEGYKVVGIINDFNVESLHNKISPTALIYTPNKQFNTLSLRLTSGNIEEQILQLKIVWEKLVPNKPLNFTFYDDQFQAMYMKEEKLATSITFFSIIAIVLTCMGILGQIFMTALIRTKEIGIRKINGASTKEILYLLNKDIIKWVAIAFVIGCPIAYYIMSKWLENFAYKTSLSWWVFALAGLFTLGITLLTVSWQSWRAATRNPVEALRDE